MTEDKNPIDSQVERALESTKNELKTFFATLKSEEIILQGEVAKAIQTRAAHDYAPIAELFFQFHLTLTPEIIHTISSEELYEKVINRKIQDYCEKAFKKAMMSVGKKGKGKLIRKLSLLFHPDKGHSSNTNFQKIFRYPFTPIPLNTLNSIKEEINSLANIDFFSLYGPYKTWQEKISKLPSGSPERAAEDAYFKEFASIPLRILMYFSPASLQNNLKRYPQPIKFLTRFISTSYDVCFGFVMFLLFIPVILILLFTLVLHLCTDTLIEQFSDTFTGRLEIPNKPEDEDRDIEKATKKQTYNPLSHPLLYLKIVGISLVDSLTKPFPHGIWNILKHVIKWPFKFLTAVLLFALTVATDVIIFCVCLPIGLAFFVLICAMLAVQTVLCFVLNLPLIALDLMGLCCGSSTVHPDNTSPQTPPTVRGTYSTHPGLEPSLEDKTSIIDKNGQIKESGAQQNGDPYSPRLQLSSIEAGTESLTTTGKQEPNLSHETSFSFEID